MKLFKTILKALFTAVISLLPVAGVMGIFSAFELRIPFLLICVLASVPFIVFILILKYPDSVKFISTKRPVTSSSNFANRPDPNDPADPSGFFNPISPSYIHKNNP